MKVTGDWLSAAKTQAVFAALTAEGHRALAVGGCVRNALMNVPVTDVDIATDATPETVMDLGKKAGLKAVPTGIDHGTITLVSDGTGYEVTTFRADTETDGRHAVVRFSKDLNEDAARRDFTMNAIYADATGDVHDPLNGLPDLQAGHVRFIGDAKARIEEDFLRILRFFRFAAWYGDPDLGFDAEALSAIAVSLDGLQALSRERVTGELLKLLSAQNPALSVGSMVQTGVLSAVLPGCDMRALAPLVHLEEEQGVVADPIRRLASLGPIDPNTLRLSKKQTRQYELYQRLISEMSMAQRLGYEAGYDVALDVMMLRSAVFETPLPENFHADIRKGSNATFPVKPADLMPNFEGAKLGQRLHDLEERWIASGFSLTKAELLS